MANTFPYRMEPTKQREFPCTAAIAVNAGDLVWWDSSASSIKKASAMTFVSEALQRVEFARKFVGISLKHSPVASDFTHLNPVSVATAGVFELPCAATTFVIGDLIGAVDNAGATALENQVVAKVTATDLAFGRCIKPGTSVTTVTFEIFPPFAASLPGTSSDEYFEKHVVTAAENTANQADIVTGFGTSPSYFTFQVITVATGIQNATVVYSEPTPGTIRIADGSTTLATGDLILIYARR